MPDYLVRDRDRVYGEAFTRRIRAMGIRDRPTAPRSPWQNGYAERLIGSIRRECLDHGIVFGERHLRQLLRSYQQYYNGSRTHLALAKDSPLTRSVQRIGAFSRCRSSADCTIVTSGSDFRQGQLEEAGYVVVSIGLSTSQKARRDVHAISKNIVFIDHYAADEPCVILSWR